MPQVTSILLDTTDARHKAIGPEAETQGGFGCPAHKLDVFMVHPWAGSPRSRSVQEQGPPDKTRGSSLAQSEDAQPKGSQRQDRQEATASLPPEGPDPRRKPPGAGVFRGWSLLEKEPPGAVQL